MSESDLQTYTKSVYVANFQGWLLRVRVTAPRDSTRAVLWEEGESAEFAQDRVALMSTRPRRIRNLHTSRAYQIARGLVPRSAPNPEREKESVARSGVRGVREEASTRAVL